MKRNVEKQFTFKYINLRQIRCKKNKLCFAKDWRSKYITIDDWGEENYEGLVEEVEQGGGD